MDLSKTKIFEGIYIIGKALWLEKVKILVIADLHIGYEEYLNELGIAIPRQQFKLMHEELKNLLNLLKPKLIVINGDLKHEFGEISKQEWNETLAILDLCLKHAKVVLVKGNHDTILEPIARKKNVKIVDYYVVDSIVITHGHKILNEFFDKQIKTIVIAHEHPAISLREGIKVEKYKCWLIGRWHNKKLIVMPSFMYIEGSDITKEMLLSPFLTKVNLDNFEIYIVADKVYKFGKLKMLRKKGIV